MFFTTRADAGAQLAEKLESFTGPNTLIVGVARGGVPVAAEVALALDAPLDVVLVRKLGLPQNEEFAFGAIAEGGIVTIDEATANAFDLTSETISMVRSHEERALTERSSVLKSGSWAGAGPFTHIIVVDDGLATGASARAALAAVRTRYPDTPVILAAPVCAPDTAQNMEAFADEVVCAHTPRTFGAVGQWYTSFEPVDTDTVLQTLAEHHRNLNARESPQ